MSNPTPETITEATQETVQETMINDTQDVYDESEMINSAKTEPELEIGDELDLSSLNINSINPAVFRKLSYWQKWSLRRQAGIFYYTATYAVYTFTAYVAIKMFYQVYAKDFSFKLDWWCLPLAIGVGLTFWFVHETIYKKKLAEAAKK